MIQRYQLSPILCTRFYLIFKSIMSGNNFDHFSSTRRTGCELVYECKLVGQINGSTSGKWISRTVHARKISKQYTSRQIPNKTTLDTNKYHPHVSHDLMTNIYHVIKQSLSSFSHLSFPKLSFCEKSLGE